MRIKIFDWSQMQTAGDLWWRLLAHRHEVFIDEQEWEIPSASRSDLLTPEGGASSPARVEFDQYDSPLATYFVVLGDDNEILASARAIRCDTSYRYGPYTVTYMIKDAYDGLLDKIDPGILREPPACDASLWEVTRLTCRDQDARVLLFQELNRFLALQGAHAVLSLCSPLFGRWIRSLGFQTSLSGPIVKMECRACAVVRTEINYEAAGVTRAVIASVGEETVLEKAA